MRARRVASVAVASLFIARFALADAGTAGKGVTYSYEIENLEQHAEQTLLVWPRTCGSSGSPLGSVNLALNPDWSSRLHEVDYEVVAKGKKHQLSTYCGASSRLYALPVAAFPRGAREAGVDDRGVGQEVGGIQVILPVLDAIDITQRIDFFAKDARALRSAFRFDVVSEVPPTSSLVAVHDVLAVEAFDAKSFNVTAKRAVYTYGDGTAETLAWSGTTRPSPTRANALLSSSTSSPSAPAGPSATVDAGGGSPAAATDADLKARTDRGTRWVYMAAVGGLLAGGVLAYLRKKRSPAP